MAIRDGSTSCLGLWLEFVALRSMVSENELRSVTTFAHHDRYATWLGGLCAARGVKFRIVQHGAIADQAVVAQIHCDEVVCFNELERELFRKHIVANDDCDYVLTPPEGTEFRSIGDASRPVIAVAAQGPATPEAKDVIRVVNAAVRGGTVLVYPHHEDRATLTPPESDWNNRIVVSEYERHDDIDLVITFFSSIVYDYLSAPKFKGRIWCVVLHGFEMAFYSHPRVSVLRSLDELRSRLEAEWPGQGTGETGCSGPSSGGS
ncbi:MAG: hypothetical protein WA208_14550 [Thermoanaerobaculia bacterium]